MIDMILKYATNPSAEKDLRRFIGEMVQSLRASAGRGNRPMVKEAEKVVQTDPHRAFAFDLSGLATLAVAAGTWQAGRFETVSIGELRKRAAAVTLEAADSAAQLWVLDGASPVTDIGSLQATADSRALFQVASQFNCLESPGPHVTRVNYYFSDPTQGPRAAISAFPATLLRHYAAPGPDGERFVQATDQRQIDLLTDVFAPRPSPVRNGYLEGHAGMGAHALVSALETGFDRICIGVHESVGRRLSFFGVLFTSFFSFCFIGIPELC